MTLQMAQPLFSSFPPLDAPQAGLLTQDLGSSTSTAYETVNVLVRVTGDDNKSGHHAVL